jgi:hypothetical protein
MQNITNMLTYCLGISNILCTFASETRNSSGKNFKIQKTMSERERSYWLLGGAILTAVGGAITATIATIFATKK